MQLIPDDPPEHSTCQQAAPDIVVSCHNDGRLKGGRYVTVLDIEMAGCAGNLPNTRGGVVWTPGWRG